MTTVNLKALKLLASLSINITGIHQEAVQFFNGVEIPAPERKVKAEQFAEIYAECVPALQELIGLLVKPEPKAKK